MIVFELAICLNKKWYFNNSLKKSSFDLTITGYSGTDIYMPEITSTSPVSSVKIPLKYLKIGFYRELI